MVPRLLPTTRAERRQPDGNSRCSLDLLKRWIAESYRAVAPKKLAALLPDERG